MMLKAQIILFISLAILGEKISGAQSLEAIDFKMVQQLAKKMGEELESYGDTVTKRVQLQESFSQAKVVNKNGTKLVDEIAKDIKALLDSRVLALKRIIRTAENLPRVHENTTDFANYTFINTRKRDKWKKEREEEEDEKLKKIKEEKASNPDFKSKKPKKPAETPMFCFRSNVTSDDDGDDDDEDDYDKLRCFAKYYEKLDLKSKTASVFVPTDVFDKDGNITRIIHRSRGLDTAFNKNYRADPSIGWQYFCNGSGVFRHFPATSWKFHPVNTYDCRTRNWYTGAASSTKDVIIMIEMSGSMKGSRIIIAKDVVRNILNTLTPNDFFNIIRFNEDANFTIDCTRGLVQATSSNIIDFKESLDDIKPEKQSNLAHALDLAFQVLRNHTNHSANCNQVIFLITDGMEYNATVRRVFMENNWNRGNPVRVFSYLIGEQIPERDYEQIKMMACENRGYHTQIDKVEETREQVLKYIPVMARPLSYGIVNENPVVWSTLYADILEPNRLTPYDWNCRQQEVQRKRVVRYLREYDYYPCLDQNDDEVWSPEYRKYVFMTTVSMPAFERVTGTNASLMGVAAIDVPLFEFERLFQSYRSGVGGYAFVIDQNGNILTHPDFRPLFQKNILKPAFNSLDMSEVELMDDGYKAREFHPKLLELRASIIEAKSGSKFMRALQPYDDMRRAIPLKRNYFWRKIDETPFIVVVTFPDHASGAIHVSDEADSMAKGKSLLKYFKDDFRLHPDWIYCRAIRKSFEDLKLGEIDPDNCEMTPEEELMYYLEKFESSGARWRKDDKLDSNDTRCDRKLMNLLLFDAKITENYPSPSVKHAKEKLFELKTSFLATHSGLFRFKIFDKENISSERFANNMKKAIDEVWYKHTVDYNRHNPNAFVYSVAHDAYERHSTARVTATRTVYVRNVPAAVVGYQISHSSWEKFIEMSCPSDKIENCYVLDDNALIIYDPYDGKYIGKFFGEVERKLMHLLVQDKIYDKKTVFDYQAVCYQDKGVDYEQLMKFVSNSAMKVVWNPIKVLLTILLNILSKVYGAPSYIANLMYPDDEHYYDESKNLEYYCPVIHDPEFFKCLHEKKVLSHDVNNSDYLGCAKQKENRYKKCIAENGTENILKRHVKKTLPKKCDKFNDVYTLTTDERNFSPKQYDACSHPFVVHRMAHSNLILLKTNRDCKEMLAVDTDFHDVPMEIKYDNSIFCLKQSKPQFNRTRPNNICVTKHAREPVYDASSEDKSLCGGGNTLQIHGLYIAFTSILLIFFTQSKFRILNVF